MINCFLIVNCNDYKSTKHLIDNIKSYSNIDHILIVDNNSKPEERELLKELEIHDIEIIYNDDNRGYSYGINIGAKYLIDKYKECNLIISNSDIVIMSEEDLDKLIDTLNNNNGIVGPQLLERGVINKGWKNSSVLVDIASNFRLTKNLIPDSKVFYDNSHYKEDVSFVDVISSCFFLINSKTLEQINYMDENVFLYYEDSILSKKINDLGYKVSICNNVKVKHNYSVSVDKIMKNTEKYKLLTNSMYYYQTTYNKANKFERFLLRISFRFGTARSYVEYQFNKSKNKKN